MTYEEAKIQIQAIPEKIWDQLSEPDREAMEMAFSALQVQEAKHSNESSSTHKALDTISRQAAVDYLVANMTWYDEDGCESDEDEKRLSIEDLINGVPSAHPEIEERKEESAQNVPKEDLISRKAAIDALWEIRQEEISDGRRFHNHCSLSTAVDVIKDLPSAQPEIKPISYQDCANAMMMMWIDDVLTDGEYRRIMDKLNDHESRRENR